MNDAPRRFTHDEQVLGGQRGGAALRDRHARERAGRDRAILKILQRAGGRKETSGCYGEYVAVCAEKGWPVPCYRAFNQYVAGLIERGLLRKTVIVLGSISVLETTGGVV